MRRSDKEVAEERERERDGEAHFLPFKRRRIRGSGWRERAASPVTQQSEVKDRSAASSEIGGYEGKKEDGM